MTYTFVEGNNEIDDTRKNLSDIYLQSQLRVFFIDVIISLSITTCFGPYGPSSSEYNI
jgi:hypothetical protein